MSASSRLNPPTQSPVEEMFLSIVDKSAGEAENNGTPLRLSSLKGSIVVLFVLGIDCGTCKYLAGALSNLHYEYAPDVFFVGLCVQHGCQERLMELNEAAGAAFPLASCPSRELCSVLRIPKATWLFFPTMIFLDQQQRLRGLFIGGDDFFLDAVGNTRELLDELQFEVRPAQACSEVTA